MKSGKVSKHLQSQYNLMNAIILFQAATYICKIEEMSILKNEGHIKPRKTFIDMTGKI